MALLALKNAKSKTTVKELQDIMGKAHVPSEDYTILQPGLILGGITTAKNTELLAKLGVTHILNAAYDHTGKGNYIYVQTNEQYFKDRNFPCKYLGIRAMDLALFKLYKYFDQAAEFIDDGVSLGGVVYVHCYMGISRSAILVIVYLMIKRNMTAKEAVTFVRKQREICANEGFIKQVLDLEDQLMKLNEENNNIE